MLVLGARVLLATVFAVAGMAKLRDYSGVRRMVAGFGFPAWLTAPAAGALICCELGVAAALAVSPSAQAGGLAGVVPLAGFSAVISWNVARGRHPACHCFGRLASAQVGWSTVARNALLAAVAGCVAADGRLLPALAAGLLLPGGEVAHLAAGRLHPPHDPPQAFGPVPGADHQVRDLRDVLVLLGRAVLGGAGLPRVRRDQLDGVLVGGGDHPSAGE
jgi:hypothetical protein